MRGGDHFPQGDRSCDPCWPETTFSLAHDNIRSDQIKSNQVVSGRTFPLAEWLVMFRVSAVPHRVFFSGRGRLILVVSMVPHRCPPRLYIRPHLRQTNQIKMIAPVGLHYSCPTGSVNSFRCVIFQTTIQTDLNRNFTFPSSIIIP